MPEGTYYHPADLAKFPDIGKNRPSWRRSSSTGTGRSSRMARSRRGRNPLSRWPWPTRSSAPTASMLTARTAWRRAPTSTK